MSKTILVLAWAASALLAQSPAPAPAPLLMRLYPVALDANGQPVTDLTAADFKITDQNKPETVYYFHGPRLGNGAKLATLEFSNRPDGGTPHNIAVVFDMMNQNQSDRLDGWKALNKSVPQIQSPDNVYFYILNMEGELVPIHPIGSPAADNSTWPQQFPPAMDKAMNKYSHARAVEIGQEVMAKNTYHALEVVGGYLTAFPGRRDIIWITNGFQNAYNTKTPCNGDWVECALYVPHMAVALAKANVSVNIFSNSRDLSPDVNRDMEQMGLLTGGHCYFRQDLNDVVKQVSAAQIDSYDIAYDPGADNWDNKFHRIRISCERKGVKLLVRERYYALPDQRSPEDRAKGELIAAYQNPGDLSGIGLNVKLAGAEKGVNIDIHINTSDILIKEKNGKYTGAVTFLLGDRNASGPVGNPNVSAFNLDLTKDQYDKVAKEGIPLNMDHAVGAGVDHVRLIVMDGSTNTIGSLTFPVH